MTVWYVYYRVQRAFSSQLLERVTNMQALLRRDYEVSGEVKRRMHEQGAQHTWMEIYLDPPENFEHILETAVHTLNLGELIEGERRIEKFGDPTLCA